MPTFTSPITTTGLLDMFNEGGLPPGPAAFVRSLLDGVPDWPYLDSLRVKIKPLGFHWEGPVDILDYLAVAGAQHDPIELAILSLFDHGDGARLLSVSGLQSL